MDNYIDVPTSGYAIGASPQILRTTGIGSCIAICLFDKNKKMGALTHIMLPKSHDIDDNPLRYNNTAIPMVVAKLEELRVQKCDLVAQIIGGANMFPSLWSGENSVGDSNIAAAKKILEEMGIPIEREDIGGNSGRSLEFELEYGKVLVVSKDKINDKNIIG